MTRKSHSKATEAQEYCMEKYSNVYLMGLGVPDPKGVFGSTLGLQKKLERSECLIFLCQKMLTGLPWRAVTGMRPILTHQRWILLFIK